MLTTQNVQNQTQSIPPGVIFGYQDIDEYSNSPEATIKAINRMVAQDELRRLSKGKFYRAKLGLLGERKPSEDEIIKSMVFKNGRLRGYVTGIYLFNQLGLTTQVPSTIELAMNGGRQTKSIGTISVKIITSLVPIEERNIKLLKYLDVLKSIKKIPDSDINQSLQIMSSLISKLSSKEQKKLLTIAKGYYGPQVRALLGLLFETNGFSLQQSVAKSLNPISKYMLGIDINVWPKAKLWNIQ